MADITITEDMTLNVVIKKYPSTVGVFNRFNVDSCCGGARSIATMAREDNIDTAEFIQALKEAAGS